MILVTVSWIIFLAIPKVSALYFKNSLFSACLKKSWKICYFAPQAYLNRVEKVILYPFLRTLSIFVLIATIGSGMVRVMLSGIKSWNLPLQIKFFGSLNVTTWPNALDFDNGWSNSRRKSVNLLFLIGSILLWP